MIFKKKILVFIIIYFTFFGFSFSKENYYDEAKEKFSQNHLDDSKFLFQKNIVFNPKDAKSYLYLAKIFNIEENEKEEEKNLNTTLLLDPKNEEAMYMLIKIKLKKSNYSEVQELKEKFVIICVKLCEKTKEINNILKNIEPKNDS
tara:strand:- start:1081 stop:1518 length:438 start_codon:yes stop_codon:yes gene_type:complete